MSNLHVSRHCCPSGPTDTTCVAALNNEWLRAELRRNTTCWVVTENMMHQFLGTESCYNKAKQKTFGVNHVCFFSEAKQPDHILDVTRRKVHSLICVSPGKFHHWKSKGLSSITRFFNLQHLSLTCFLSRDTHLESMEPRVRLGIMWFKTFARKTCKQPKHIQALLFIFARQRVPEEYFSLLFFLLSFHHLPSVTETEEGLHRSNHLTASLCMFMQRWSEETHSFLLKKKTVGETLLFFVADLNSSLSNILQDWTYSCLWVSLQLLRQLALISDD